MGKINNLDSATEGEESERSDNLSSDEDEECGNVAKKEMSEYEKQRQSRMAENKARMEALGLHKMASSLMGSVQKSSPGRKSGVLKGKRKVGEEDDDDVDYRPIVDDGDDDDDDDDAYEDDKSEEEDEDDEYFVVRKSSSKSGRSKVKKRSPQPKKKVSVQKLSNNGDFIDEEDPDLMQAIALSLQESVKDPSPKGKRGTDQSQKDSGKKKGKKSFSSRVKMTEDEVDLHFFQLDESGKGVLTLKDLRRVANAHDFTWTDKELADMIYFFDSDRDGKLNLDDFHKIVERCNMIQGPESS